MPEGESREFEAESPTTTLMVSAYKVSVKSSDESIFTAEIITNNSGIPKDIVKNTRSTVSKQEPER